MDNEQNDYIPTTDEIADSNAGYEDLEAEWDGLMDADSDVEGAGEPAPAPKKPAKAAEEVSAEPAEPADPLEGLEEVEEAEEPSEEPSENPRSWKLTVNGREIEVNDEAELVKRAQMGYAAYEKFEQAAEMMKHVQNVKAALSKTGSPEQLEMLRRLQVDLTPLVRSEIERLRYEASLSQEQLERHRLQQERDWYAEQERLRAEEYQRQVQQQQLEQDRQYFEQEFTTALKGQGLPGTPQQLARVAAILRTYAHNGYQYSPALLAQVVEQVREETHETIRQFAGSVDADQLMGLIGQDGVQKLAQKGVRAAAPKPVAPAAPKTVRRKKQTEEPPNLEELFRDAQDEFPVI